MGICADGMEFWRTLSGEYWDRMVALVDFFIDLTQHKYDVEWIVMMLKCRE